MVIRIMASAGAIGMLATGASVLAAQPSSARVNDIICAVSNDCAAPAAGEERAIGEEKAFSLVRGNASPAPAAPKPSFASAPAPSRPVRHVAAHQTAERQRPADSHAPGSIDMRVSFDNGSASLTEEGKAEALAFAKAMQDPRLAESKFEVRGHTDAVGNRDYNMDLSQRRAQAVADFLKSQGISAERINARGVGFDEPLTGTRATAPVNRRVEFMKLG